MLNKEIAHIFNNIADMLEMREDNPFRIRAYRKAAYVMEDLAEDADKLVQTHNLEEIPGIGKDLASKIEEYVKTGKMISYEELKKEIPQGVLDVLSIQGVGPKTAKLLYDQFKIDSVEKLEEYAKSGRIKGVKGIKDKTVENILKGIELKKSIKGRFPLGTALPITESIIKELNALTGVDEVEVAGSIRRRRETIGDIDILAIASDSEPLMNKFVNLKEVERILSHGTTRSSVILKDTHIQVDLRVLDKKNFGASLLYFTGSKDHNIKLREIAIKKGLKLNEYGLLNMKNNQNEAGATEQEIYKVLDMQFIPPEIREDQGEIELAVEYKLPDLIMLADIRGDVHTHTVHSDGDSTVKRMAEHASKLGYEYIAITDHSQSLGVAGGLDAERLKEEMMEIDLLNKKQNRTRILKGMEVDILSNGSLDMDTELLGQLDIVIGSIHSGFKQTAEQITNRLTGAMKTGLVDVIGHPSGRLIGERDSYDVNWDKVFEAAAQYNVAMEINSYPLRLDLIDIMIRKASGYGVKFMITTDSHDPNQMRYMSYGVSVARRGWLKKDDVINTKPYEDFVKWLGGDR